MKILKSIHNVLLSILDELKEPKEQIINITLTGNLRISKEDLEKGLYLNFSKFPMRSEQLKEMKKYCLEKEFDSQFNSILNIGLTDKESYSSVKSFYVNRFL
jgi:hypothetical protein